MTAVFLDKLNSFLRGMLTMYTQRQAAPECRTTAISDTMATYISAWYRVFYGQKLKDTYPDSITKAAVFITNFTAVLATSELEINTGDSARAVFIKGEMERYVLPEMHNTVQLAAAGGEVVLKPFLRNRRIMCDFVPADRFYPTRINAAKEVEAAYFTDFATYNERPVVRVEFHDWRADGYYIHNEGYFDVGGSMRGKFDYRLVPEWAEIEQDAVIHGLDRPLFAVIKMPMTNTVDNSSLLPVSLYANSLDALAELDRIYGEFLHEIHSGKRKRIISVDALDVQLPGNPDYKPVPYKDLASDLYLVLDIQKNRDGPNAKPFDDYTPEMRVEAYQNAINVQLRLIEKQCGFTEGTFTFDIKSGQMTATQVTSDDRDTYNLIRAIQERGMRKGLQDLVYIYNVYAQIGGLAPAGAVDDAVTFGDSVFEDTGVEFARRLQLANSGYIKKESVVAWYFGVSEDEAKAMMPPPEPARTGLFGLEE